MIWHIFKKDWKLLWKFGLAVAVLPFAIAAIRLRQGHGFEENEVYSALLLLLEIMFYFGAATLAAAAVQQDGLVSVRQDWLVRPVRRRDLLAAKLLFLAIAVQLPLYLANLAGGLIDGFAFSASFSSALTENLYFLFGFALPILAFASLTRNMTEALGGAFALFIAVVGVEVLFTALNGGSALGPTTGTGVAWIPQAERLLIYFVAAAAILALQYLRRAASISRRIFGAAVVLCLLTQILPWRSSFGLEKALSSAPPAAGAIAIQFDPAAGKFHSPVVADPPQDRVQTGTPGIGRGDYVTQIYIPVKVAGLGANTILKIDRAAVRLVDANGRAGETISPTARNPGDFEVSGTPAGGSSSVSSFEPLLIRNHALTRLKNTPVTLRVDYSATLLKLSSTNILAPLGANRRIAGVGWCRTELNDNRTAIEIRCVAAGTLPQCSTALLENPATGAHNPEIHGCQDDYAPYLGRYKPPDTILHEGANLYFRDTAGLVRYPVDGSQIGSAEVVLKSYAVAGHFSTSLLIPSIRMGEWAAP